MNWRVVKTVCAAVVFSAVVTSAFSQNYYIVIGAFAADKGDVKQFTSHLPGNNLDTAYTVYQDDNLVHLYVLKTSDRQEALEKSMKLQREIENRDPQLLNSLESYRVAKEVAPAGAVEKPVVVLNNEITGSSKTINDEAAGVGAPVEKEVVLPKGKFFKFLVSTPEGGKILDNVHYVNMDEGREIASYATYGNVDVLRPAQEEPMTVVCGIFGYKEIRKDIDYIDPAKTEGAYRDDDGAWVIPYKLERLQKWDVSVMYNLAFYKDASFMLPPSRRDLDELVMMMKSNPNYVIRVHAHCNAKNSRKIIVPGKPGSYFDVDAGAVEVKASAKELTRARAELVKEYLIENGIDKKRIKTYGWGGSEMLVDKNSVYAKLNDRIEIEILED